MEIQKEMGEVSAVALSDYILKHYGPMSHLKLQKLLYYCDAYHLAYFERQLVDSGFQAWVHGPVCVEVYHALKGHSVLYSDVSFNQQFAGYDPDALLAEALTTKQVEFTNDVLSTLSTWRDSELEASTHRELPWIEARAGKSPSEKHDGVIDKRTMMSYYKKDIVK